MLNKLVSNLMQRVVSNNDAPYAPRRVAKQPLPVYLELKLLAEDATFHPLITVTALKPGKRYFLQVWATVKKLEGHIPVVEGSQLQLALRSNQETIAIHGSTCTVDCCLNDYQPLHRFSLQVAAECPVTEVEFWFCYPNNRLPLKMKLAGTYFPVSSDFLKRCGIDDTQPDENIAFLHISQEGIEGFSQPKLRFDGRSRLGNISIKSFVYDKNSLSLGELIQQQQSPETIRNLVRMFAQDEDELIKWLQDLEQRYQEKLILIIVNHTDSELPWEMVELDYDQYLGTTANLVRWGWISGGFGKRQSLHMSKAAAQCGEVLCYLSEKVSKTKERQFLKQFAVRYTCTKPTDLKQQLEQPLEEISLVYLACHGTFYSNPQDIQIGDKSEQINLVDLMSLTKQNGVRPLFFVNACHSARLQKNHQQAYGLPRTFMSTVASGYIGTMAKVKSVYAATMAQKLLGNAHIEPAGIPITERLKQIRREVVEQLKANPTPENWEAFINTFLYVYYGNPLARLKLKPNNHG